MLGVGLVDEQRVERSDEKAQEEQPEGVTRLVVLWVCWVVLAVFLVAAGVVGFS
ncbi:MAG: hypothetical protein ACI89X_003032 [Planctomycetota bacterium]|jgi:hypothetical protein